MAATKPDCRRCKHYYNTWEQACPRGCRIYGFKSQSIPSIVVKRETGRECQGFEEKASLREKRRNNLNDPSNW